MLYHKVRYLSFNFAVIVSDIFIILISIFQGIMKIDKTIKPPEGVSLLMENMRLRHKVGMNQRPCNVFMVEFPPLTEEEKAHSYGGNKTNE